MLALQGSAVTLGLALALLFSAVPVYAVTEVARVFKTRIVSLPDEWTS